MLYNTNRIGEDTLPSAKNKVSRLLQRMVITTIKLSVLHFEVSDIYKYTTQVVVLGTKAAVL